MHTLKFSKSEINCFQTIQGSKYPAFYNNFQLYIAFKEATEVIDRVIPYLLNALKFMPMKVSPKLQDLSYEYPPQVLSREEADKVGFAVLLTLVYIEDEPQTSLRLYCKHDTAGNIIEIGEWKKGIGTVFIPERVYNVSKES